MKLKLFNEKILIKIFLIFYTISVFLDLHLFYNSISTLIRALFISIFFILIIINKGNFKEKKYLFIYGIIILFYLLFHHLNALNFKSFVPNNFNYNLLDECLYFFKMLSNVFIFYIVYKLNIKYLDFKNYLKVIILFLTLSIIITDILSLSYTAYNFERTTIPFYHWFSLEKYDFILGSSKGLFHMTNQVVAIFLLYLPIISFETFKNKKTTDYILTLLIVLSMLLIGNRLAIYGTILEIVCLSVIYFIINFKKKINYKYYLFNSLIILGIFLIIPHTPLCMREYYYESVYSNESLDFMNSNINVYDDYDEPETLEAKFQAKEIDPQFPFVSYPYKYDKKFWDNILKQDVTLTGNARYIELQMVKRVKEINNNKLDNLFGLTYTRVMNIFNIEKDFVMQFYTLGIIGCLLFLGLYFILFIYIGIKILFDLKHKFNEKNIALLMGSSVLFISAYFSGNLLNAISIIIPLSFILTILVNEVRVKRKKENYEKVLGFKVSTLNQEEIVKKIMETKNQMFIVNINPFIVLDNKDKKEIFNQEEINIPDGEGIVLLSKLRGGNVEKRIAGIDLMLDLCQKSEQKIYLYGAKEGVAKETKKRLENLYPKIKIVGTMNGYSKEEEVIKDINKTKPEIIFIALGSPKQEDFIIKNKDKLKSVKVLMPVGGSFDVISGNLKRASKLIQALKLEWLYRMIKEPKRFKGIIKLIQFIIMGIFYQE